jgi:hypothetical protein
VHHGGNIDGFSAELNFLPNDSIGVVVLTNMNGTQVRDFIPYLVYDRLLGLPPVDWSKRFKDRQLAGLARAREAQAKEEAMRRTGTSPSHPLDDYVGTYTHPGYGPMTISKDGSGLRVKFMSLDLALEHYHFDTFRTVPPANDPLLANLRWKRVFTADGDGDVISLAAPVEAAIAKGTTFTRPKPRR